MKIVLVWDMTPCGLVYDRRHKIPEVPSWVRKYRIVSPKAAHFAAALKYH